MTSVKGDAAGTLRPALVENWASAKKAGRERLGLEVRTEPGELHFGKPQPPHPGPIQTLRKSRLRGTVTLGNVVADDIRRRKTNSSDQRAGATISAGRFASSQRGSHARVRTGAGRQREFPQAEPESHKNDSGRRYGQPIPESRKSLESENALSVAVRRFAPGSHIRARNCTSGRPGRDSRPQQNGGTTFPVAKPQVGPLLVPSDSAILDRDLVIGI